MHEILTLQFGHLANYVGTHFWNTQESYFTYDPSEGPSIVDHDISFRPGVGADGSDTYTPRVLIYDLKNEFGSLRKVNDLYEIDTKANLDSAWQGDPTVQVAPPIEASIYQVALETGLPTPRLHNKDVRYWSDYNRVYFHPRSLLQISPQSLTAELSAFNSFEAGSILYKELDHDCGGILDRDVRPFVEECDNLQGLQVFGSNDGAWGGFMSEYAADVRDEFGKKSIWVWGLQPEDTLDKAKQSLRLANSTRTLNAISTSASAYIRTTTIPHKTSYIGDVVLSHPWISSALISSVIESATLPIRLRTGAARNTKMAFMEDFLGGGRDLKLWQVKARARPLHEDLNHGQGNGNGHAGNEMELQDERVPLNYRMVNDGDSSDEVHQLRANNFDLNLAPESPDESVYLSSSQRSRTRSYHTFSQIESIRASKLSAHSSRPTLSQREILQRLNNDETITEVYQTALPFPILDSFPYQLFSFSKTLNAPNDLNVTHSMQPKRSNARSIELDAALSTTSQTKYELLALRNMVAGSAGRARGLVSYDEQEAIYDEMTQMAEKYSFEYEDEGSESD